MKQVLKNAALSDTERLSLASSLLGRELTKAQKDAILFIHKEISKGVYKNKPEDIQKMINELQLAGFSVKKEQAGDYIDFEELK